MALPIAAAAAAPAVAGGGGAAAGAGGLGGTAAGLGSGLGGLGGFLGSAKGQPMETGTAAGIRLLPNVQSALFSGFGGLQNQAQLNQALAQQLQSQALGSAPSLQQQFSQLQGVQAFQPGQAGLDVLGRGLVSQGTQALQQQALAQQRALQRQFGGQPGIAQALGRQAAGQARLQANPLLFQAAQGAAERGQQGFQNVLGLAQQQAGLQQLANQAALQQQQAGQAARQEGIGLGQGALQSLLASQQAAQQLGELTGERFTTKNIERKGGLFK